MKVPVKAPHNTISRIISGEYDEIDSAFSQSFKLPDDRLKNYGNIETSLNSTVLQGLSDAVNYLIEYPYGCTEQLSSKVLTTVALNDIVLKLNLKEISSDKVRNFS